MKLNKDEMEAFLNDVPFTKTMNVFVSAKRLKTQERF